MNQILRGIVRGRIIELQGDPGLDDGQQIEVELRPLATEHRWGDGIRRSAGALSDWSEEDDRILDEIAAERNRATFREIDP